MGNLLDQYWFWALLAAVFAALTAIFAKVGVTELHPDYATFLRTIVVLVVLGLIVAGTGVWRISGPVPLRSWIFLILSGLGTGASWLAYFRAMKLGDAARVAPLDKLSIVLVAIFGVLFLGEKLSAINWVGVALIAAGALLVAF
ncbi:MAG: EamA family transporter [Hyphomicrobiaceae bacterium]|nr:EamA family transporter [Hyphomicrobiaceae bacterium]MCC0024034.1 EamA family transporter [Hyphomicrobiaceae bacterium]